MMVRVLWFRITILKQIIGGSALSYCVLIPSLHVWTKMNAKEYGLCHFVLVYLFCPNNEALYTLIMPFSLSISDANKLGISNLIHTHSNVVPRHD